MIYRYLDTPTLNKNIFINYKFLISMQENHSIQINIMHISFIPANLIEYLIYKNISTDLNLIYLIYDDE